MSKKSNLFDAIAVQGTDDGYRPRITEEFQPTNALAGSQEKLEVLRWRVEHGLPLWHWRDRAEVCFNVPDDLEAVLQSSAERS